MTVGLYARTAQTIFGPATAPIAKNAHLRVALQKAHIDMRPELYISVGYMSVVLAALAALGIAVLSGFANADGIVALTTPELVAVFMLPVIVVLVGNLIVHVTPDIMAGNRARDIDARLPYALNYVSTMAGANFTPETIFANLAKQPVYGEVANEAAWITRDLKVLGKDILGALTAAINRSPSEKWQDLLQGAITTITSGGQVKDYFRSKSEQFLIDNRQEQKKFLDSLAVLAESYVVVAVAGPVFVIVLLSVMLSFGSGGSGVLFTGYVVILVILPLAQAGFATAIKFVTPQE
ncbi:MAG: type II secretion system F family protein [Thermoplasmatota archaeon]